MAATEKIVFTQDYTTEEIYSTGVEFALLGRHEKQWQQAMTFVHCKDFLHDAVWATLHKQPVEVYNFKYDPQKDLPIHLLRVALAFRNRDLAESPGLEKFHAHLEGCMDFLQQVDQELGFRPTHLYPVKHNKGPCWLVLGDRRWLLAPPLISMYSLLIRTGYYHNPGGHFRRTLEQVRDGELGIHTSDEYDSYGEASGTNDSRYVEQAWDGLEAIFEHGAALFHDDISENYPQLERFGLFHNDYGIVNFAKKRPEKKMPKWYRKSFWKTSGKRKGVTTWKGAISQALTRS
jgi:hypothetical protein